MAAASDGHANSYEMTKDEANSEVSVQVYAQLHERAQSVEVDAALIAEREQNQPTGKRHAYGK